MVLKLLGLLWSLLMLPVKVILLPFKILSFIVSVVVYGTILLILSGLVIFFVL